MPDDLDSFINKKDAESPYISLIDGDSIRVKRLESIKMVTKVGFGGDEVECMRYACVVETEYGEKKKNFDNSSARFAKEMRDKGAVVGSSFTITRDGEGPKTRYNVSDVVVPQTPTAAQEAAAAAI